MYHIYKVDKDLKRISKIETKLYKKKEVKMLEKLLVIGLLWLQGGVIFTRLHNLSLITAIVIVIGALCGLVLLDRWTDEK